MKGKDKSKEKSKLIWIFSSALIVARCSNRSYPTQGDPFALLKQDKEACKGEFGKSYWELENQKESNKVNYSCFSTQS
jgi:hypothetical protein